MRQVWWWHLAQNWWMQCLSILRLQQMRLSPGLNWGLVETYFTGHINKRKFPQELPLVFSNRNLQNGYYCSGKLSTPETLLHPPHPQEAKRAIVLPLCIATTGSGAASAALLILFMLCTSIPKAIASIYTINHFLFSWYLCQDKFNFPHSFI